VCALENKEESETEHFLTIRGGREIRTQVLPHGPWAVKAVPINHKVLGNQL